ncbi:sensor histidine kinase [Streptococcus sp. H49]|uniref:sensor histidine kinase n=1 Tax=Streptococcus huangxiaojuni TaxID=3237239 RepID=UPI0034A43B8B
MIKNYSIRQRVWFFVIEIVIATVLMILLVIGLTIFLKQAGQISGTGTIHMSLDSDDITISDIKKEMKKYAYDYVVFDNKTNKIVYGNYMPSDVGDYETVKQYSQDMTFGSVVYTYSSNTNWSLTIRQNSIPEFTNHSLRSISYNSFTYVFFFVGEICAAIFLVYRLVKEFSKSFQNIQEISLNMGKITVAPAYSKSRILEFEEILTHLYEKSGELAKLIKAERQEKKDLSFQVAALSHDVKTPITVLKGNIELLEMTDLTEQQTDFINSMKNGLSVFEKYFNLMISYTQLINDDSDYKSEVNLSDFLNDLSVVLEELANTYQIAYQLRVLTSVLYFHGSAVALSRAITNIFVNACQYAESNAGEVILTVKNDNKNIYFEIWNNGKPFSEYAKKNATKLFYTEDTGRSGKHYGIGLSFAQGVARKHKGDLIVSNPQSGGAIVSLKILI